MPAAPWRLNQTAIMSRHKAAGRRGGFTLIEMMVTVTLVLLMMLMFAEIYSLAQETMSKQKGMAQNDQRARILMEVVRSDLQARTFRSVYPFKLEDPSQFTPTTPMDAEMLDKRRGYFHYSENDVNDSTDDVLQLTVDVAGPGGHPGRRIYGKATEQPDPILTAGSKDGPEYDDGREGDVSGSSSTAEVVYFLREGNLYRSVLLVRQPYLAGTGITDAGLATPVGFPGSPGSGTLYNGRFWNDYDYSAYREEDDPGTIPNETGLVFHGPDSLSNNPDGHVAVPPERPAEVYGRGVPAFGPISNGGDVLFLPRSLGAPQLRYGFSITPHGQPFEFDGVYNVLSTSPPPGPFFGRLNAEERSVTTFPGTNDNPFGEATPPTIRPKGPRRGIDLMLPNVHSFDVQIWDDVVGDFVDLGHDRMGINPYRTRYLPGSGGATLDPLFGTQEPGFYHSSRWRTIGLTPTGNNYQDDYINPLIPNHFGNRFDTWSPNMWIEDGAGKIWRTGRAPYRPFKRNPDPNDDNFNQVIEPNIPFGKLDIDMTVPNDDAEAPVRAIRIVVRYLDTHSGQTRQATIEQSLVD